MEIRFLKIDEDLTVELTNEIDPATRLCSVYFILSDIPDERWQQMFLSVFVIERTSMIPKYRFEDGRIVTECRMNEIKGAIEPDIIALIDRANGLYKQYLESLAQEAAQQERQERHEIADRETFVKTIRAMNEQ